MRLPAWPRATSVQPNAQLLGSTPTGPNVKEVARFIREVRGVTTLLTTGAVDP